MAQVEPRVGEIEDATAHLVYIAAEKREGYDPEKCDLAAINQALKRLPK